MANDPRITDADEVLTAACTDASGEGARLVKLTLIELWQMVHRVPMPSELARSSRVKTDRTSSKLAIQLTFDEIASGTR